MEVEVFALKCGWVGMLLGVLSGAMIGMFFHKEKWMGGYGSHPRRFMRLGHISFFGIGLLCMFYGFSLEPMKVSGTAAWWGAYGLLVALVGMPSICFLTAWKKFFRHLYFIPVCGATMGIVVIMWKGMLV